MNIGIKKILSSIIVGLFTLTIAASTDPALLMLERVDKCMSSIFACDRESEKFSTAFSLIAIQKIEQSGDPLRTILEIDFLINRMTSELSGSCGDESLPSIDVQIYTQALVMLLRQMQNLSNYTTQPEMYHTNSKYVKKSTRQWCSYLQQSAHPFHFFQLIAQYVKASGLARS